MKNLKIYRQDLLLEQLNVNRVPNIGKVIRDSGITVMSTPSMVMKDYRALSVIDSSWNGIYINKKVSKKARRFISTYMYCYIQLYYNEGYFSKGLLEEESFDKKAYHYALKLLMPEKIFKTDIEKGMNNRRLSKKYKVSMFLINERLNLMEHEKQKAKLKVIQGGRRR